jgi:hypothetical protein
MLCVVYWFARNSVKVKVGVQFPSYNLENFPTFFKMGNFLYGDRSVKVLHAEAVTFGRTGSIPVDLPAEMLVGITSAPTIADLV